MILAILLSLKVSLSFNPLEVIISLRQAATDSGTSRNSSKINHFVYQYHDIGINILYIYI